MSVSGVSGSSGGSMSGSRETIAQNFDTFLQLLTTQLRHQNPLDPLNTNEFTAQLVQFTSVEQQLKTNEFLEAMMLGAQTSANSQAVSYIGKQVVSTGSRAELTDSSATFRFMLEQDAAAVTVTIRNEDGSVVYTEQGTLPAGEGEFRWDGRGNDGTLNPDGPYSITIDARDQDGGYVPVTTRVQGTVTGVDFSGSEPVLLVGDSRISLSTVESVVLPSEE